MKSNLNNNQNTLSIDFNSSAILAYNITSCSDLGKSYECFIIDENNAYLIKNRKPIKHWEIAKSSYDMEGGEFITKEGDTISLSKNILIKKLNGEEIAYEYEAIDISQVIIDSHYFNK